MGAAQRKELVRNVTAGRKAATLRPQCRAALAAALAAALLGGCGGGSGDPSLAQGSGVQVASATAASSPFIGQVQLANADAQVIESVSVTVEPRAGATAAPAHYTYDGAYIVRRGWSDPSQDQIRLPVFALYGGSTNKVDLHVAFRDGSATDLAASIATPAYADPNGIYDRPVTRVPRDPSLQPGFSYVFIKSGIGAPVVVDVDGQVRWSVPASLNSGSSIFTDNGFVVGDAPTLSLVRFELDGTTHTTPIQSGHDYSNIHHNIDPGKQGMLVAFDTPTNLESTFAEISASGAVIKEWDLAKILSDYLRAHGEDPSDMVRPSIDWFHMNASAYDPSDDSVIVSSRENFLIKIDYASGDIKWIFGDPTKYWYQLHPSLRALSLSLGPGGFYPIGQHAVSVLGVNRIMLFNNGAPSTTVPAGASAGESRSYSAVSAYSLDPAHGSASELSRFDYGQSIDSPFCSSAYRTSNSGTLVSYATAENFTKARLVGLDPQQRVVFDYEYASPTACGTSWNAQPIPFEAMTFE
jgi:hypothetical protein